MGRKVLYKEKCVQFIGGKNRFVTHIALEYYPPNNDGWDPHEEPRYLLRFMLDDATKSQKAKHYVKQVGKVAPYSIYAANVVLEGIAGKLEKATFGRRIRPSMVKDDIAQLKEGVSELKELAASDFNSSDMYTTVLNVGLWYVVQILRIDDYLVLGQRFEKNGNIDYLLLQFQNEQTAVIWHDRMMEALKDSAIIPEKRVDYQSFLKSFSSAPESVKWPAKWDGVELICNDNKSDRCEMVLSKMNEKYALRFNFFDDSCSKVLFISDIQTFGEELTQIKAEKSWYTTIRTAQNVYRIQGLSGEVYSTFYRSINSLRSVPIPQKVIRAVREMDRSKIEKTLQQNINSKHNQLKHGLQHSEEVIWQCVSGDEPANIEMLWKNGKLNCCIKAKSRPVQVEIYELDKVYSVKNNVLNVVAATNSYKLEFSSAQNADMWKKQLKSLIKDYSVMFPDEESAKLIVQGEAEPCLLTAAERNGQQFVIIELRNRPFRAELASIDKLIILSGNRMAITSCGKKYTIEFCNGSVQGRWIEFIQSVF